MPTSTYIRTLSCLIILLSVVACSEAPEEYNNPAPPQINERPNLNEEFNLQKAIESELLLDGTFQPSSSLQNDERARQNSKKEIIYGIGAGGITFKTTLSESEELLSKPVTITSDNIGVYESGMYVFWKTDDPKTPALIWLNSNYQGVMKVGGDIGDLRVGSNISKYFTSDSKRGEKFIISLYNHLENKDGYNCLTDGKCDIKEFETHYLFLMDKLGTLVSKDRNILADIRLIHHQDLGKLENDFELIESKLVISSEQKTIQLGQTWKEIQDILKENPEDKDKGEITVTRDSFQVDFGGVYLIFTKSKFDRDYKKPDANEKLNAIAFASGYTNYFKINGKHIRIEKADENEIKLTEFDMQKELDEIPLKHKEEIDELRNELAISEEDSSVIEEIHIQELITKLRDAKIQENIKTVLGLRAELPQTHQKSFLKKMKNKIIKAYKKLDPDAKVSTYISGLYSKKQDRNFGISVYQYNEAKNSGKSFFLRVSERSEKPQIVEVSAIDEAINAVTAPSALSKLSLKENEQQKELAGFTIGQRIELKDIDLAREEATAIIEHKGKKIESRVRYKKNYTISGIYRNDGKVVTDSVQRIVLSGSFPVHLSIVPAEENKFKIIGIASGSFGTAINGLCEDQNMSLKYGENDEKILKKIESMSADCQRYTIQTTDGSNKIQTVYFPEKRVALGFYSTSSNDLSITLNREFTTISIYYRPSEVQ